MTLDSLLKRVKSGNFKLCVIGIGRVGLPLALVFADSGVKVSGIDIDRKYVEKVNKGETVFHEAGIEKYIGNKNFEATTDKGEAIEGSNVIILTIGTPLTEHMRPDYSQLYSAVKELAKYDIRDKLIIMRSTSSPDTTESYVKPFLEKHTKLKAGKDFALAVCPERILEGKAFEEVRKLPEIIGGINEISSKIAAEVFKKLNPNKEIFITTPKAAELAKLFTNVYRYVNFALANEFGLIAEEYGEDAHEIIKLLNRGYKRGGVPIPGLAGGPCLSKDGYYLISNIVFPDFILMAWRLNESIPNYIVNKVKKRLHQKGKKIHKAKIAILGLAFKAGIDDTRYSPSTKIVELLKAENADVRVHDPYVKGTLTLSEAVKDTDCVILATNHKEFKDAHKIIRELGIKKNCIFMDCWGFIEPNEAKKLGFDYMRFGSGK